ncbi:DUF2345 domain-containing protein, partial [Xanthomonas fragariae]
AQLSAGQTLSAVSGQHTALFAQRGPITLIAAAGPVSLQAHTGALELLADQALTVTATDTRIDVLAQQKIVLQAGQTRLTLEGGDITFACPGQFTVKASRHPFLGGEADGANLTELPYSLTQPMPYSLRWQTLSAITLMPTENVDVIIVEAARKASPALVVNTATDGRTERLRDEKQAKSYNSLVGSGGWAMLWTGEHTPKQLESEDWLDWEIQDDDDEDA